MIVIATVLLILFKTLSGKPAAITVVGYLYMSLFVLVSAYSLVHMVYCAINDTRTYFKKRRERVLNLQMAALKEADSKKTYK